jgi:hypothetical protein
MYSLHLHYSARLCLVNKPKGHDQRSVHHCNGGSANTSRCYSFSRSFTLSLPHLLSWFLSFFFFCVALIKKLGACSGRSLCKDQEEELQVDVQQLQQETDRQKDDVDREEVSNLAELQNNKEEQVVTLQNQGQYYKQDLVQLKMQQKQELENILKAEKENKPLMEESKENAKLTKRALLSEARPQRATLSQFVCPSPMTLMSPVNREVEDGLVLSTPLASNQNDSDKENEHNAANENENEKENNMMTHSLHEEKFFYRSTKMASVDDRLFWTPYATDKKILGGKIKQRVKGPLMMNVKTGKCEFFNDEETPQNKNKNNITPKKQPGLVPRKLDYSDMEL